MNEKPIGPVEDVISYPQAKEPLFNDDASIIQVCGLSDLFTKKKKLY